MISFPRSPGFRVIQANCMIFADMDHTVRRDRPAHNYSMCDLALRELFQCLRDRQPSLG
jgi:hypothetical protein